MVLRVPGHRIARRETARAAVGATILSAAGCKPVADKMVGPRTSLGREAQCHHAGASVSQSPSLQAERASSADKITQRSKLTAVSR